MLEERGRIMTTTDQAEAEARSSRNPRAGRYLGVSAVLLVLGLGAGILVGRATVSEPAAPADLASARVSTFLDQQVAALNSGDAARIRPFYAEDATFTDIGNRYAAPLEGGDEIAEVMAKNVAFLGPFAGDVGTPIERGDFVAYVSTWGDVSAGVIVLELDAEGKILNQWVIHTAQ